MSNTGQWIGVQPDDPHPLIYLSGEGGIYSVNGRYWPLVGPHLRCMCFTYRYVHTKSIPVEQYAGKRMFLDSAAHTYQAILLKEGKRLEGRELDTFLEGYAKFILETPIKFDFVVTADVVREPQFVWDVTKKLEALGVRPIPVFHNGAPMRWLERWIDAGYGLIGISIGMPGQTAGGRMGQASFLDLLFNVSEKRGVKLHGFAVTGWCMFPYPWYSVDSSSWVLQAANGRILKPQRDGKGFHSISSSERTTPAGQRSLVLSYEDRLITNAKAFNTLMDIRTKVHFQQRSLF